MPNLQEGVAKDHCNGLQPGEGSTSVGGLTRPSRGNSLPTLELPPTLPASNMAGHWWWEQFLHLAASPVSDDRRPSAAYSTEVGAGSACSSQCDIHSKIDLLDEDDDDTGSLLQSSGTRRSSVSSIGIQTEDSISIASSQETSTIAIQTDSPIANLPRTPPKREVEIQTETAFWNLSEPTASSVCSSLSHFDPIYDDLVEPETHKRDQTVIRRSPTPIKLNQIHQPETTHQEGFNPSPIQRLVLTSAERRSSPESRPGTRTEFSVTCTSSGVFAPVLLYDINTYDDQEKCSQKVVENKGGSLSGMDLNSGDNIYEDIFENWSACVRETEAQLLEVERQLALSRSAGSTQPSPDLESNSEASVCTVQSTEHMKDNSNGSLSSSPRSMRPNFKATAPKAVWSPTKTPTSVAMEKTPKDETKTVTFATDSEKQSPSPRIFATTSVVTSVNSREIPSTVTSAQNDDHKGPFTSKLQDTKPQISSCITSQESHSRNPERTTTMITTTVKPLVPSSATPGSPTSSGSNTTSSSTTSPTTTSSSSSSALMKLGMSRLPPSQSPTITLLQKAREGQITRGAVYIDDKTNKKAEEVPKEAVLIDQRTTVEGNQIHQDSLYALPTREVTVTRKDIKAPKYEGIGPLESGIPTGLRSGVKKEHASDWYKSMYRSLHRNTPSDADWQTVKYHTRGHTHNGGGYMSEPELDKEDEYPYGSRYATIDCRRHHPDRNMSYEIHTYTLPRNGRHSPPDARTTFETYRNQPKSIADYEPGHSSIAEREAKMDDEMDFAHQQSRKVTQLRHPHRHFVDGYESDSTLIRKTGRTHPLDPHQQKMWYREIQRGGEVPFTGLAKPAPEKPKASPHRYQETEVNIHYRSPIRTLEKEYIEEEELRKKQEAAMRRFYEVERQKKQMQQLAEIEMRRHSDNFVPSQKSPIPLNRYDEPFEIPASPSPRTPEPRTLARVKFDFTAQTARELALKKGDIVYILKRVDKNWYEGEHHGMIGIFPTNYVEVIPPEEAHLQPRKPVEGQARAKYNFRAQTPVELSLFKGEMVVLIRRVDQNWFEGRIGGKRGIFPASYVDVIRHPVESSNCPVSPKPPASPVYSQIVNGSRNQSTYALPVRHKGDNNYNSVQKSDASCRRPLTENLHIDTYSEPIPYRVLYAYRPQNDDELELREGDTVYVMEKCDDGWYVGTSLRTGLFGTFPGNYVERI